MEILKIGLAYVVAGRLLVVRKKGSQTFILPGGKPEPGESELETLQREIREELECVVEDPEYVESFSDWAADEENTRITVKLYRGRVVGNPYLNAEIEEMKWIDLDGSNVKLASSIVNQILPYLRQWYEAETRDAKIVLIKDINGFDYECRVLRSGTFQIRIVNGPNNEAPGEWADCQYPDDLLITYEVALKEMKRLEEQEG